MPSGPNLYSIPSSVPFLPKLVESLTNGTLLPGFRPLDDPLLLSGATIYLPTRRAARLLPDLFQAQFSGNPVLLPAIRPIGDADEDLQALSGDPDLEPMPPAMPLLERHLAMTRLVMAWKGALRREALDLKSDEPLGVPASAADAAWLAGDLLALMDEVETEEASWTGLAGLVPEDHARYWQITLDFLRIVEEAWPHHLSERGMSDPKARRSKVIRREAERLAANPPKGPVIVAGVTGSIPATAELLKVVAGLPNGVLVLPGLDFHLDDTAWKMLSGGGDGGSPPQPGELPVQSLASHPQASLRQLLDRLGVSRAVVTPLGEATPEFAARERIVSEALRPAETSENWMSYLGSTDATIFEDALSDVGIVLARNETHEALSVSVALREAVERGETAALISPDRMLTRRVAAELQRWKIEVDDSAGRPLDQTAPAILSILAAKLALNGCDPLDLLSLLKHPLCRLGLPVKDIRSAARALERGVLRGPRTRPGTQGLRTAVEASRAELEREEGVKARHVPRWKKIHDGDWDKIADLVDRLSDALEPLESLADTAEVLNASDLAKLHLDVAEAVCRDEEGSPAELYVGEAGDALARFFAGLLEAESGGFTLSAADWPSILPALMAGEAVRRRRAGDPRVQILGPMEARLQHFDLVVLGGLNEGIWPQRTRNDPWLNRPMKRDLGLAPPERRIGSSAHDFVQGLGARRVLLTRALRADGAPTVASRWLQRLTTLAGAGITKQLEKRGKRYAAFADALDRQNGPVTPAARPCPKPAPAIRPQELSVTEIERLVRDPYAIFARHVLALQEVDPIGGEPGAADKGNIIHDALAEFLETWDGPFDDGAVAALTGIGEELFAPLDAFPAIRALWWPRFLRIADGFVSFEAHRAHSLTKRFLETGGGVNLALPGFEFRLTGRADRIDLMADGSYSVIDYKTGQVPSQRQIQALLAPQLLLEAAMIDRGGFSEVPSGPAVEELLYIQLKGGAEPISDIPVKLKDVTIAELSAAAWTRLEELIAHYTKAETGYLSRARVMRERQMGGTYDHLARVQEWSVGSEEAE